MKINKLLLFALVVGFVLRIIYVSVNPPSLTPDEASLGYNAYSILKTGRDEYGKVMPVIFKSFGDYKPGLYVYLTVPFVASLGLTEFPVRLPSVLFGTLAIYLIYLIVKELFKKDKLAGFSALLLAIAPWHVFFSRGAWEANVSLTLTLGGIYFFLTSFRKKRNLIYSAVLFAATLITYQGAKLSTLIVLVILTAVYWKECRKLLSDKKTIVISTVLGLVIAAPILLSLFGAKTGRLTVFSIFSYPRPKAETQALLNEGNEKVGSLTYYLFHSDTLNFKRAILGRWFNHFSGQFLFFEGDWKSNLHSAPYTGMFVIGDIILFLVGFVALARTKGKEKWLVFSWIVLSPLPAALSRDDLHAVRALNEVVPLVMMASFGGYTIYSWGKKEGKKILLLLFVLFYLATYSYFLDEYFVHLPKQDSQAWGYGYKQAVETVVPIEKHYQKIVFQQSYEQPYIYFLFYQKYDPVKYQKSAEITDNSVDVGLVPKLDNIEFTETNFSALRNEKNVLIIADPAKVPVEVLSDSHFSLIKDINYLDGVTAFRILETK